MKLFSSRYPAYTRRYPIRSQSLGDSERSIRRYYPSFLEKETYVRLLEELSYFIENSYLEKFLIVNDKNAGKVYLNKEALAKLFRRTVGYDLSNKIDFENLNSSEITENEIFFMDFVELFCIFTLDDKRDDVISRLNSILEENNERFKIFNGMLLRKNGNISSSAELYKENLLGEKFKALNDEVSLSNKAKSKISADIVQYIFSSDSKSKDTKEYSEELLKSIAEELTAPENSTELAENLNSLVKLAKSLNNGITDIRHTDRHTIPISSPDIYALIHEINMGIVDLVIKTTPNKYLTFWNPEELKKEYFKHFGVKNTQKVIEQVEFDPEELPF